MSSSFSSQRAPSTSSKRRASRSPSPSAPGRQHPSKTSKREDTPEEGELDDPDMPTLPPPSTASNASNNANSGKVSIKFPDKEKQKILSNLSLGSDSSSLPRPPSSLPMKPPAALGGGGGYGSTNGSSSTSEKRKGGVPFPFKRKDDSLKAKGDTADTDREREKDRDRGDRKRKKDSRERENDHRDRDRDVVEPNNGTDNRRAEMRRGDHWEPPSSSRHHHHRERDRYRERRHHSRSRSHSRTRSSSPHRLPPRKYSRSPSRDKDRDRDRDRNYERDYGRDRERRDRHYSRNDTYDTYDHDKYRDRERDRHHRRDGYEDYDYSREDRRGKEEDHSRPTHPLPPKPSFAPRPRTPPKSRSPTPQTPPFPQTPPYPPPAPPPPAPKASSPLPSTSGTPPGTPPPPPPSQPPVSSIAVSPPPQPSIAPPPPPPPDERLRNLKPLNDTLPDIHSSVSITLRGGPRSHGVLGGGVKLGPSIDRRSPPDIFRDRDSRDRDGGRGPRLPAEEFSQPQQPPPPPPPAPGQDKQSSQPAPPENTREAREREMYRNTRKHMAERTTPRRSQKEEQSVYGRSFVGCGEQADYNMMRKLGEGTFGEVHKAQQISTKRLVALKRILMHNEKEGMPVTALREIKILKAMKHPNVVDILDMFVIRSTDSEPLQVFMVFPYMDHDLAGLLENERVKLQPSQIKLYMKQLLEGTEYMHRNNILHRDMKAANLLISNTGELKIADFGLARCFDPNAASPFMSTGKTGGTGNGEQYMKGLDPKGNQRKYTNCVVTRWYRPPELLMGARIYGGEVDIWGIGCVMGEMFVRRPILPGTSDLDQLEKIWQLCGTPNQHSWPHWDSLPGCDGVKRFGNEPLPRRITKVGESMGMDPPTCDLLDKLLTLDPRKRITAAEALDHDYFWIDPLPADPKTLPVYEASHEYDKRGQRHGGQPPMPAPVPPAPRGPPAPGTTLPASSQPMFNHNRMAGPLGGYLHQQQQQHRLPPPLHSDKKQPFQQPYNQQQQQFYPPHQQQQQQHAYKHHQHHPHSHQSNNYNNFNNHNRYSGPPGGGAGPGSGPPQGGRGFNSGNSHLPAKPSGSSGSQGGGDRWRHRDDRDRGATGRSDAGSVNADEGLNYG